MHRRQFFTTFAAGVAFSGAACSRMERSENVLDVARGAGLRQFIAAVEAAGLASMLETGGPVTVFAPNNDAFAALEPDFVDNLMLPENQIPLRRLVAGHILPAAYDAGALSGATSDYVTAAGTQLAVGGPGGALNVAGARVIGPGLPADNGFVFTINRVLLPG